MTTPSPHPPGETWLEGLTADEAGRLREHWITSPEEFLALAGRSESAGRLGALLGWTPERLETFAAGLARRFPAAAHAAGGPLPELPKLGVILPGTPPDRPGRQGPDRSGGGTRGPRKAPQGGKK